MAPAHAPYVLTLVLEGIGFVAEDCPSRQRVQFVVVAVLPIRQQNCPAGRVLFEPLGHPEQIDPLDMQRSIGDRHALSRLQIWVSAPPRPKVVA